MDIYVYMFQMIKYIRPDLSNDLRCVPNFILVNLIPYNNTYFLMFMQ